MLIFMQVSPVGVETFHVTLLKCLRKKLSCITSTIHDIEPPKVGSCHHGTVHRQVANRRTFCSVVEIFRWVEASSYLVFNGNVPTDVVSLLLQVWTMSNPGRLHSP